MGREEEEGHSQSVWPLLDPSSPLIILLCPACEREGGLTKNPSIFCYFFLRGEIKEKRSSDRIFLSSRISFCFLC